MDDEELQPLFEKWLVLFPIFRLIPDTSTGRGQNNGEDYFLKAEVNEV